MNTSKQVNVMIGLMFVTLIGVFLYFIWDDIRAEDATEKQLVENAERGGKLFSLNCRACHGMNGLGTIENTLLPGLPLNVDLNRPMMPDPDDPSRNVPDLGELMNRQNIIRDSIRCGRVGTLMPAWAEDQGGPLNDFQIQQLVALITGAMPGLDVPDNPNAVSEKGWEAAVEEAIRTDFLEGKQLAEAVGLTNTTFVLTDAGELVEDSLLRIDDEVVKIVTVAADSDEITVERAAFATEAAEHEEGAQLFNGPIEPPTGPLTGENGTPPCGQLAAAPSGPSGEPIPIEGQVTMEMGDNFFQTDGQQNPIFEVSVGQEVTIDLVNNGLAIHNMHIAGVGDTYDAVFCEF
ncbi:MAG: c-type cytochrome, partial [Chloroflexi bacterium]|nr:c-type cytochrome [Chloroflexota bacterium]